MARATSNAATATSLSSTATAFSRMELPMKNLLARFAKDESGATAIEYALIAAGIAVAIVTAVNSVGSAITAKFEAIKGKLD